MGEDSTELSPVVRKIFDRTLQMQNLVVHDVLLPRNQVVIYDLNESLEANLRTMKEAGHTRFPLCRGDLDACIGIIHIKDIFRQRGEANQVNPQDLKRSISQFPQETPLEEALQRMLRAKFHMALVSDEFGRVIGLITLESILESLVGDIQDEFDSDEEQVIPMQEPDTFKVSGLTPLHDIEEALGLEVSNEDVSTIGGLVTAELGYIPEIGETLSVSGMRIKVIEVDERRVISVHLEKEGVALSDNPEPY
jgi:CBS domain containing-hemolysin-like protein